VLKFAFDFETLPLATGLCERQQFEIFQTAYLNQQAHLTKLRSFKIMIRNMFYRL